MEQLPKAKRLSSPVTPCPARANNAAVFLQRYWKTLQNHICPPALHGEASFLKTFCEVAFLFYTASSCWKTQFVNTIQSQRLSRHRAEKSRRLESMSTCSLTNALALIVLLQPQILFYTVDSVDTTLASENVSKLLRLVDSTTFVCKLLILSPQLS